MNTVVDEIYGEFEVEDVISEIIDTDIFQRMNGIYTGGAAAIVNEKWRVTRLKHSIGTMLLSKLLGGNTEQQIKSLLHDISHTAFSHVVDYVIENEAEDFHDSIQMDVVNSSSIPKIMSKYGYNIADVFEKEYLVLDADLPDLSIDRIDYTLRDMVMQGRISVSEAHEYVDDLLVHDGIVMNSTMEKAIWFYELYDYEVNEYFPHPLNKWANNLLTEILKESLNKEYISLKDFIELDDEKMMQKIEEKKDQNICEKINLLRRTSIDNFVEVKSTEPAIKLKKRLLKPKVLEGDYVKSYHK